MKPTPGSAISRRRFLRQSASGALAGLAFPTLISSAARAAGAAAPSNQISVGLIGAGPRGLGVMQSFLVESDARVVAVCDVKPEQLQRARELVNKHYQNQDCATYTDFRALLIRRDIDAVIIATPDHWHVLIGIAAVRFGKDVYVEKPLGLTVAENQAMRAAVRATGRVFQFGTQQRSSAFFRQTCEIVRNGRIGKLKHINVWCIGSVPGGSTEEVPVPPGFDYETWCGPAPVVPYDPSRRWLDRWEFSCGAIAGDAVHQIDLARALIGDKPFPDTVSHAGGVCALTDGREIPDTQMVTFEFGKLTMLFESALWTPYMTKTPMDRRDKGQLPPNWALNATRIEVLGTKGFMYYGRHGDGWQVFNEKSESVVAAPGRQADKEHHDNFIACIKNRQKPAANVEQGHYSAMLCHLGNISYRVGNKKLAFDAKTETFKDAPEANKFLKRTYRAPWVIPDNV